MLKTAIPVLASLNEEETVKFYTEKLGFTFNTSWDGYLIMHRDDLFIHLWPCDNPEIAKNTGCYIFVTDVDTLYAEYKPRGIVHPNADLQIRPWKTKEFSILDNNGNIIHFGEDISDKD